MNPKNGVNVLLAYVTLLAVLVGIGCTRPEPKSVDPLLSWNEGASKESILQFVEDITNETSPNYVPPEDRIATFDNDGTLWAEKPTYVQVLFLFQRIREMATDHPEWKQTQPYKAVLEKDYATLGTLDEHDVLKLALTTHAGMTQREFVKQARSFLDALARAIPALGDTRKKKKTPKGRKTPSPKTGAKAKGGARAAKRR